jgi:transcriptional regulator with XRE-family HTH domain
MENGKPLKRLIGAAGLTQIQVAKELGIHASRLSMVVSGYANLNPELVPRLAELLHVSQKKIADALRGG